jgi:hypothetical protein
MSTKLRESKMSETMQIQNLDHDDFSYYYDVGDPCVILVDLDRLTVEPGDRVSLGEDGEEGTYGICAALPLHPDFIRGRPVALVLSEAGGNWESPYIDLNRSHFQEFRDPEGVARSLQPCDPCD